MHQRPFRDYPESTKSDLASRAKSNLIENVGQEIANSDSRATGDWALLGGLGSHDLSAMRDVIGMPKRCICATRSDGDAGRSMWWNAIFEYEGFKAIFEVSYVDFVSFVFSWFFVMTYSPVLGQIDCSTLNPP